MLGTPLVSSSCGGERRPYVGDVSTDTNVNVLCEHGKPAKRFIAFEGLHIGRRFMGCGEKEGINCGVVHWIDFEWPESMENTLDKLWDMYEESKAARTIGNLESSFSIHNLTKDKKKLEENYEKLYGDMYDILKNLTAAQAKINTNLKNSHLKEKERLTIERHKLQHHISELQKCKEKMKFNIHYKK
ncbi:hypothetical protein ZWY2020_031591 [Hordeum vulgare]|nr:hypothetical protein ZWY2020_031591 [Hordeum vulgare]